MRLRPASFQFFFALYLLILGGQQTTAQSVVVASKAIPAPVPQTSGPSPDTPGKADGLIHLDVLVADESGKPVTGLGATDFTLFDNGQTQKILSFQGFDGLSAKPDPPVELILLVDTLAMPADLAPDAVGEVVKFLRQNGGLLARPTSVFGISENGLWTVAHPSGDGDAIAEDLIHNRQKFLLDYSSHRNLRGEPLDSLVFREPPFMSALKAVAYIAAEERRKPGRKLLLWIGPGCGIGSGAYPGSSSEGQKTFDLIFWFSTLLREARIEMSTFSVGESDPRSLLYKEYLNGVKTVRQASVMYLYKNVLAVESGGQVLETSQDLVKQMDGCVRQANAFYTVSFNPAPAAHKDEFHDLKVKLSRPGLTARTNTGYYDQPYYSDQTNPAIRRITVAELQQQLLAARALSEGEVASQLSNLELTERLSDEKLASWTAELRGKQARQALTALADQSAFLEPPPEDTSSDLPPDQDAQRHMISLTAEYLRSTMPRLPDFFAKRISVRYEENPEYREGSTLVEPKPTHEVEHSKATVIYRNGSEVLEAKAKQSEKQDRYLITYGTFGPLLRAVMDPIAAPGGLAWSRWEKIEGGGRRAIFRYEVSAQGSRYQSGGCCLPDGDGTIGFRRQTGYHGEIAIDPTSGAILRLTMQAYLGGFVPLNRSDIMIAYRAVEIGGKKYICPIRSVSISRARSVATLRAWNDDFKTWGPYTTMLNDFVFEDYHMFRAQSRMLSDSTPTAAAHDGTSEPSAAAPSQPH
jgi:VWFA-related protein